MCKMPNIIGIDSMNFKMRGKFSAKLTDGREIIVPISWFPDIKALSIKQREEWMILDDQYFTFEHMSRVYSVLDLLDPKERIVA